MLAFLFEVETARCMSTGKQFVYLVVVISDALQVLPFFGAVRKQLKLHIGELVLWKVRSSHDGRTTKRLE